MIHPYLNFAIIIINYAVSTRTRNSLEGNAHGKKEFNKHDAPILTTIAENYLENGFVFRDDLATVSHLIQKYHAQWGE